jgi:hypothetical protein
MADTGAPLNLSKNVDGDNARTALSTDLPANMQTINDAIVTLADAQTISGRKTLSHANGLALSAAASKIVPGATSLSLRNNADDANNLLISNAGAVTVRSVLTLTGGQIAFPAAQADSADVNTLDDYEEGTWEAAFSCGTSGTITIDAAIKTGYYTKIGRAVFFTARLGVGSVSSPVGAFYIGGLPFTVAYTGAISVYAAALNATGTTVMQGYALAATTTLCIEHFTAGASAAAAADIKASSLIVVGGVYFV